MVGVIFLGERSFYNRLFENRVFGRLIRVLDRRSFMIVSVLPKISCLESLF